MNRIHQALSRNSSLYNNYHKHPNNLAFTWTAFVIAALSFTAIVFSNINKPKAVSTFASFSHVKIPPTETVNDVIKPDIYNVKATTNPSLGPTIKFDITWITSEPADSLIDYGKTTSYGTSSTLDSTFVTSHSVTLNGLQANTIYHFRIKSKDAAGNLATSPDYLFNTSVSSGTPTDTTAPIITDVSVQTRGDNQMVVVWRTNEDSDGLVQYGTTKLTASATPIDSHLTKLHSALINNLTSGVSYYFRVKSKDSAGNVAVSEVGSFKAGKDGGLTTPPTK